jgi:formylglycine-generating enzyme required for sulfatase activity
MRGSDWEGKPTRILLAIVSLLLTLPGTAPATVTIDWVSVGDPGNACDTQSAGCFGAVAYSYQIGEYEVTNAQYAEFLNAVADTDTHGLYITEMGSGRGGITRSGSSGSYTYSAIAGREGTPVNYVSFYDSLRFANWLHNGQPTGAQDSTTTETGAYDMSQGSSVVRKAGAKIFLTSEDEWYKAAYYDSQSTSYFDYPAGSDTQTTCAVPGPTPNTANCDLVVFELTDVGSYPGSPSPYGTFDQGGNVWEWNEANGFFSLGGVRGGSLFSDPKFLASSHRSVDSPVSQLSNLGFRVASIPGGWFPPLFPHPFPALPKWGYVALAGGLIVVGAVMMRRRAG